MTVIETGSFKCSSESWTDYMRNIYVNNSNLEKDNLFVKTKMVYFKFMITLSVVMLIILVMIKKLMKIDLNYIFGLIMKNIQNIILV